MQIEQPLLAAKYDPNKARFPYAATPKIDGIRFLMINGTAVSRSFKPIKNRYIQELLSANLPDGIDGELTVGTSFQECGAIMRIKGEPQFKAWLFDFVDPNSEMKVYTERMKQLYSLEPFNLPCVEVLRPTMVFNQKEVDQLMIRRLSEGYEGLMLRDPIGLYKFGRSTTRENILLKLKNFLDSEATIVAFKERYTNFNEVSKDAFGHSERSTSKVGLVPTGTLGSFVVRTEIGTEFCVGSGLDDSQRIEIWKNRDSYLNKIIKFKYMEHGVADTGVPRHPVFIGFRSEDDL